MQDIIELSLEQSLDHCIKCNICTSACPVSAVTDKFPGPKYVGPQAQRFRQDGQPTPDESVDYCSGCRVCNQVCPTGVRIAELNARARAKIVEEKGLSLRNRMLGHSDIVGKLGNGLQAPLANFATNFAPARWIGEKVFGVARKAPFPAFSTYTFRSWFKHRGQETGARRQRAANSPGLQPQAASLKKQVVFFHGCATNYYEPRVGQAAIEVLERNGFAVILAEQGCCGLPLLSNGAFPDAQKYHEYNVGKLYPYVQQGIPIVGTSTSCTLTLKEEAPELLGLHSDPVRAVAENTFDIFEFLRMLHERGRTEHRLQANRTHAALSRTMSAPCSPDRAASA